MNTFARFLYSGFQELPREMSLSWAHPLPAVTAFVILLLAPAQCLAQGDPDDPDEAVERADLAGVVLDEGGKPVVGAYVFVESARPRKGPSGICPSCYPDCRKRARTDAKGEFKLPNMDGKLLFRLLFVAKGYEAKAEDRIDPLLSPLDFALWKRGPLEEDQTLINARVYDSKGDPAAGAFVEIEGAETARMTTWGGQREYIQAIGVTAEDGIMTLAALTELKAGLGILQAPGHAKQWVRLVPGKDHLFLMHEGVMVTGQVVKEGRPVAGLQVGFSGSDRTAGEFLRGWEVATDDTGRFGFANVTPGKHFNVYSMAKSGAKLGVLPCRPFSTGADGTTLDLGKIELQAPLRIRGRVMFEDGESALAGTRIMLGREQAWDYQETNLNLHSAAQKRGFPGFLPC